MRDTLMIIEVLNNKEEVEDIFESAKERVALTEQNDGIVS